MRLVIDIQGAQGSSHARGIGRYSRELAMAMVRDPRGHDVIIALSGAWPDTAEQLIAVFANILPRRQIRMWHPPAGTATLRNSPLRGVAEGVRAQFLASLGPDLLHVCSLFEGLGDDTITWLPPRLERLPMVATCYDLIPLIRHADISATQAFCPRVPSGITGVRTKWLFARGFSPFQSRAVARQSATCRSRLTAYSTYKPALAPHSSRRPPPALCGQPCSSGMACGTRSFSSSARATYAKTRRVSSPPTPRCLQLCVTAISW
jgi:glycosyltransferase involved in cell wall biosynthesis